MKFSFTIFLTLFILNSCSLSNSNDEWKTVKQTCTTETYQDFLIKYPRTKHLKEITDSLRVFWKRHNESIAHSHCHGNCIKLLINSEGMLLLNYKPIVKGQLKEYIKKSILNSDRLESLPEFKTVEIKDLGTFEVSSGIIEIGTDKELKPKKYSLIIETVKEAFVEIRNDFSTKLWGKKINDLNQIEQNQIELIVPIRIRLESFDTNPAMPTPPPRHLDHEIFSHDSLDYEMEDELINE